MKLLVDRKVLVDALSVVSPVIVSRSSKPVLRCVRLTADAVSTIAGTDLETWASAPLAEAESADAGTACLPADLLNQIARNSASAILTIEANADKATIKGDDEQYDLYCQDPADYPPWPEIGDQSLKVPAELLDRLLGRVEHAAATESTRYALNGVLLEHAGAELRAVATDGRRLAMDTAAAPGKAWRALLPTKAVKLIGRYLPAGNEQVCLRIGERHIEVESHKGSVAATLIDGQFPAYGDIVPKTADKVAHINRLQFVSALKRVAILTDSGNSGCRMTWDGDGCRLTSRTNERGEASVMLACDYKGLPLTIGFNPDYLLDGIKPLDAEIVTFEMTQANRPGVVKAGGFTYLVMPVNLG